MKEKRSCPQGRNLTYKRGSQTQKTSRFGSSGETLLNLCQQVIKKFVVGNKTGVSCFAKLHHPWVSATTQESCGMTQRLKVLALGAWHPEFSA